MGRSRHLTGLLIGVAAIAVTAILAWNGLAAVFGGRTTITQQFFNHAEFTRALSALVLAEKKVTETVEHTERLEWWLLVSEAVYEVRYSVLYTFVLPLNPEAWDIPRLGKRHGDHRATAGDPGTCH